MKYSHIITLLLMFFSLNVKVINAQWQKTETSLMSGMYVNSILVKDSQIFAGTMGREGLFLSKNDGNTWIPIPPCSTSSSVSDLFSDGNVIFATTLCGFLFSIDNGSSWSKTEGGGPLVKHGANIYCGNSEGVFQLIRTGSNYNALYKGLRSYAISSLASKDTYIYASCESPEGVFRLNDGEVNWTMINNGLPTYKYLGNTYYHQVNTLSVNRSYVFAGTMGGLVVSEDNGNSWISANNGLNNKIVWTILTNDTLVFAGTSGGVFLSKNNGSNWIPFNEGLTDSIVISLAIGNSYLWAGTTNGLWRRAISELISGFNYKNNLPEKYSLYQNYPNPFNPITNISFAIPLTSFVSLKVFDVVGREVATLVDEVISPGNYKVDFDCSKLASGIYFYRIQSGDFIKTKKLVLIK